MYKKQSLLSRTGKNPLGYIIILAPFPAARHNK